MRIYNDVKIQQKIKDAFMYVKVLLHNIYV